MAAPASAIATCTDEPACASADPACNHSRSAMCTVTCQPACSIALLGTQASLFLGAAHSPPHYPVELEFLMSINSGLDPPPPRPLIARS
jgi:hypothetical protein